MKVSELIERLQSLPQDTIVTAFDADSECVVAVSGLLFQPDGFYTKFHQAEDEAIAETVMARIIQIQTDDFD